MTEDVWAELTHRLFSTARNNDTRKQLDGDMEEEATCSRNHEDSREQGVAGDSDKRAVSLVQTRESYLLCVGMPGAGKTSLLNMYLNPGGDATPKPTVALEYMFARRASAANVPKASTPCYERGFK